MQPQHLLFHLVDEGPGVLGGALGVDAHEGVGPASGEVGVNAVGVTFLFANVLVESAAEVASECHHEHAQPVVVGMTAWHGSQGDVDGRLHGLWLVHDLEHLGLWLDGRFLFAVDSSGAVPCSHSALHNGELAVGDFARHNHAAVAGVVVCCVKLHHIVEGDALDAFGRGDASQGVVRTVVELAHAIVGEGFHLLAISGAVAGEPLFGDGKFVGGERRLRHAVHEQGSHLLEVLVERGNGENGAEVMGL